ncbi:ABC transporter substrate-binding protein [Desulfacinum hydrothermale]|nr:ABC transporter substrate-binding protein [Desulfacinum hydrothermale]
MMRKPRLSWILVAFLLAGLLAAPVSALAEKPVKMGFVYIMSGPFSTYGQFAKQGAQLAIDEINAQGGILGRQVEAYFEDSTGKADVAVRAIRKLVYQNGVDVLIGLDSSGVAKTVVPTIPEMKTPLIITHAATPDVTGSLCNKYTFRISVNINQNIKAAALLAAESQAQTWSTIGPDYAFGHQSWEYFKKYLKEKKPDAVFLPDDKVAFAPIKTTDFSAYITKLMESKPDGVLVSLWGGNLIDFVRQADAMGFFQSGTQVLMTLGAATEVLYALGDKMPEGIWVGTRYWFLGNDTPQNVAFRKAYQKRFGQFPSYNAQGAYAAVLTYKAAAEKAKSTDKEAIAAALAGLTVTLPVGTITLRPEDHQALTDAFWGRTAADSAYPIRILKPFKVFPAQDVTPPADTTGCNLR